MAGCCPNCKYELSRSQIGALYASLRQTHSGGSPRSRKKRCPCGQMTAIRAAARCHYCEAPKAPKLPRKGIRKVA
jgi:hypothetical protein